MLCCALLCLAGQTGPHLIVCPALPCLPCPALPCPAQWCYWNHEGEPTQAVHTSNAMGGMSLPGQALQEGGRVVLPGQALVQEGVVRGMRPLNGLPLSKADIIVDAPCGAGAVAGGGGGEPVLPAVAAVVQVPESSSPPTSPWPWSDKF